MSRFEHIFIDSLQDTPSFLDKLPDQERGWFTNFSSTARIHSFFTEEMFSDVSYFDTDDASFDNRNYPLDGGFYKRLRPALRLASAMLKESRNFWVFILKAPIYDDSEDGVQFWDFSYVDQDLKQWWPEIDKELKMMSQNTQICWFRSENNPWAKPGIFTYGLTNAFHKPYLPAKRGQSKLRFRMALNHVLRDALDDPDFDDKTWV